MLRLIKSSDISLSLFKKFLYVSVFFTVAPIALAVSLYSLITFSKPTASEGKVLAANSIESLDSGFQVFASLPSAYPSISGEVIGEDARIELIRQFLDKHESPMTSHAKNIVRASDENGLDYRLTTAIAMKESGLGKLMPNDNCNNAWGWGIHSEGTLCFDSWEEGIYTVSKGLKDNYLDLGYITPEEIMSKWVPHSPGGLWAVGVIQYMEQIL